LKYNGGVFSDTKYLKNGESDDASMKQALMDMDGTIINSTGPTYGDWMTKR
jgi:hypothetical protein